MTGGQTVAAQQWLSELAYKPGWSFELRDYGSQTTSAFSAMVVHLLISARVPDSNTPEAAPILITHHFSLSPFCLESREAFHREVLRHVIMVEAHEAMEYLKVAGERVCTPHHPVPIGLSVSRGPNGMPEVLYSPRYE